MKRGERDGREPFPSSGVWIGVEEALFLQLNIDLALS